MVILKKMRYFSKNLRAEGQAYVTSFDPHVCTNVLVKCISVQRETVSPRPEKWQVIINYIVEETLHLCAQQKSSTNTNYLYIYNYNHEPFVQPFAIKVSDFWQDCYQPHFICSFQTLLQEIKQTLAR